MKNAFTFVICVLSLHSAPLWGQQGPVMPVLFLNGTGAHIVLPASITDNLVNETVEGWVRWESLNKWSRVFDFGKEGNAAVLQNERENATLFFSILDRTGKLHRAQALILLVICLILFYLSPLNNCKQAFSAGQKQSWFLQKWIPYPTYKTI